MGRDGESCNERKDLTPFDAPGAGTGAGQGTITGFIDCIKAVGAMTSYVIDANSVYHGYVRAPGGKVTKFDAPGSGTGTGQGTFPAGIDPFGAIEGIYVDANNVSHGFVRAPFGPTFTFDAPGADVTPGDNHAYLGSLSLCGYPTPRCSRSARAFP